MKKLFVFVFFTLLVVQNTIAQENELGAGFNVLVPLGQFGDNNFSAGGGFHIDFLVPISSHPNLTFGAIYSYNILSHYGQNFREDINVQVNSRFNEVWPVDMRISTDNVMHQILLTSKYYLMSGNFRPFVQIMGGVPWVATRSTFNNRSSGELEDYTLSGLTHKRSVLLGGGLALGFHMALGNHNFRVSGTYMATTLGSYIPKSQIRNFDYEFAPSVVDFYDFENPDHFQFDNQEYTVRNSALQYLEFRITYFFLF